MNCFICLRQNILTWNITLLTCRRASFISVLNLTVISGLQYFLIVANFLYSFMQISHWMFMTICCHKQFRISVDRNYCAMENKWFKNLSCVVWLMVPDQNSLQNSNFIKHVKWEQKIYLFQFVFFIKTFRKSILICQCVGCDWLDVA